MNWVIGILSGFIPSLLVGVVLAVWERRQNRKAKAAEARETTARQKDAVVLYLLVSTAELSHAQVMALKRGSLNGEVESALEQYNHAMGKFRAFEREQLGYLD